MCVCLVCCALIEPSISVCHTVVLMPIWQLELAIRKRYCFRLTAECFFFDVLMCILAICMAITDDHSA